MDCRIRYLVAISGLMLLAAGGCDSPYHADRGALFGGLTGAGVGALVGHAAGNTGAGAAVGAGVGALTGAAIGSEMDQVEARNRAMIAQQLGRQVAARPVTMDEVISMTRAGVNEELIFAHVQYHGMAAPLQPNDLIVLKQQGVSDRVVSAMQAPPRMPAQPVVMQPAPVMVEPYPYGPYYYDPWGPRCHYYYRPYRPAVTVGF